jgi:hypothetical protein
MKSALRLALLAAIVLLPTGCDWFGGDPDYLPLTIGSSWTYQMLSIRATADSTDTLYGDTVTMEIKTTAMMPDSQSALLVENRWSGAGVETTYWRKTAQWLLWFEDYDDDEPDTLLGLPLEQDKHWQLDEDIWCTLVGKEQTVTTASTYNDCWKMLVVEDTDDTTAVWLAPNVGRCKEKWEFTAAGVTYIDVTDLLSATIK